VRAHFVSSGRFRARSPSKEYTLHAPDVRSDIRSGPWYTFNVPGELTATRGTDAAFGPKTGVPWCVWMASPMVNSLGLWSRECVLTGGVFPWSAVATGWNADAIIACDITIIACDWEHGSCERISVEGARHCTQHDVADALRLQTAQSAQRDVVHVVEL
jgi:hypothetical protein